MNLDTELHDALVVILEAHDRSANALADSVDPEPGKTERQILDELLGFFDTQALYHALSLLRSHVGKQASMPPGYEKPLDS